MGVARIAGWAMFTGPETMFNLRCPCAMKRFFAALALAVLAASGCEVTGPLSGLEGDYVLQSINDQPLPHTLTFGGVDALTVRSYSIRIMRGNNWNSTSSYRYSDKGAEVIVPFARETGTYTYTPPSEIELLGAKTSFTGTVSGDQLTLTAAGDTWLFARSPDSD